MNNDHDKGQVTAENCFETFIETGWFDYEQRPKTLAAMERLCERVQEVFDLSVLVMAPGPAINGRVYPRLQIPREIIYLAPLLETLPQEEVDFVVAHEFAHSLLGHGDWAKNPSTIEQDTDELVKHWGFVVPDRRKAQNSMEHL
jgi:Zn-dependent protease with chaperone function